MHRAMEEDSLMIRHDDDWFLLLDDINYSKMQKTACRQTFQALVLLLDYMRVKIEDNLMAHQHIF